MTNTICIITGAASGIGRALAVEASRRGSWVIATDINEQGLAETARSATNISTHILDVADPEAIVNFAKQILPTLGDKKVILINNAGVALASGTFVQTSTQDFDWLLSINLMGVIRMTRAFLPHLLAHNQGHIVNVSSVFGLGGVAEQSAYCTAKFGVRGFTETLRMELMDTNIGTTVVHPGGIKTNIAATARVGGGRTEAERDEAARNFAVTSPTTAEKAAHQILEAITHNKARLVIGNDGKLMDFLTRLLPVGYTKIVKREVEKAFGLKVAM